MSYYLVKYIFRLVTLFVFHKKIHEVNNTLYNILVMDVSKS